MTANFRAGAKVAAGDDDRTEALPAIADGQYLRSGLSTRGVEFHPAARDFADAGLDELARISLDWAGVSYRGLDRVPMLRLAFETSRRIDSSGRQGQRSTSYTAILGNVFNKFAQARFSQVPSSWRRWCSISEAKDFKRASRVGFTDAPILERTGDNGEIKTILLADREEYQQVEVRAGLLKIAREHVFNDDLKLIANAVAELGRTGDATINKVVYDVLTASSGVGPVLNQDSTVLFHANHNNLAASGTALSVASLDVARKAMRRQSDPESGRRLNLAAKYIICPPSLESTARILASSDRIEGDTENLSVVVEAALEATSVTAWVLAATGVPTMDVAFVGAPEPIIDTSYSFDTDSLEVRARVNVGVAPLDFRGLYRNPGA